MPTQNSVNFGTGTSGQVLTSNGAGVAPTFQTAAAGTVTSVSGTTNQVAVATGTTTPVISLVGPYTPATYTAHGVLVGEATSSIVALSVGSTGQLLVGATAADPAFAASATGDFTFTSSTAGATRTFTVSNTDNTNSASKALVQLTTGGSSSGDALTTYTVSGVTNWSQGVDNSDSDAYVLAASTALGTTNVMRVATTGEINFPLQSAFLATSGARNDVTGDGTSYTLGSSTALTEIYDQNSDFNTNGTYTAPVTGIAQVGGACAMTQIGAAHNDAYVLITASNRALAGIEANPFTFANTVGSGQFPYSANVDVDAADTITFAIVISGSTKTVDLNSGNYIYGGILY